MISVEAPVPAYRAAVRVLKPPQPLDLDVRLPRVFLAGSIEQGIAREWQSEVTAALADRDVLLLNPRRDHWDPTWKQSKFEPNFREQVLWELVAQEKADKIVMYFDPNTKSPVTLLELGLFAQSGKLVVCCPEGYWRKGNVDLVCERYGIPIVDSLDELADLLRRESKPSLIAAGLRRLRDILYRSLTAAARLFDQKGTSAAA